MSSQVRSYLEYFKSHLNYGNIDFGVDCVTNILTNHGVICTFVCSFVQSPVKKMYLFLSQWG